MSGLSYICEYGDDDSQSEDSDTEENLHISKKLKLPTPNLNGVSVVLNEDHVDDPSSHGGRIRSFPHVRGNWATFVYVEYPDKDNLSEITKKLTAFLFAIDETCSECENPHISLSKTFTLRYHLIKSFAASLQETFDKIESFELVFDSVEVYCNEEKTRTFIALKADSLSHKYLSNISTKIDDVLNEYRLPKFYKNPSYHISVLSINGNKKEEVSQIIDDLNKIYFKERLLEKLYIKKISVKTGNKYYNYNLN